MLHLYSALPLNLNHVSHPFTGELVEALVGFTFLSWFVLSNISILKN